MHKGSLASMMVDKGNILKIGKMFFKTRGLLLKRKRIWKKPCWLSKRLIVYNLWTPTSVLFLICQQNLWISNLWWSESLEANQKKTKQETAPSQISQKDSKHAPWALESTEMAKWKRRWSLRLRPSCLELFFMMFCMMWQHEDDTWYQKFDLILFLTGPSQQLFWAFSTIASRNGPDFVFWNIAGHWVNWNPMHQNRAFTRKCSIRNVFIDVQQCYCPMSS